MKKANTVAREDWQSLKDRIDLSFFGDHGRPKKHIYLSVSDWEKIKDMISSNPPDIDEQAISRMLTPTD